MSEGNRQLNLDSQIYPGSPKTPLSMKGLLQFILLLKGGKGEGEGAVARALASHRHGLTWCYLSVEFAVGFRPWQAVFRWVLGIP